MLTLLALSKTTYVNGELLCNSSVMVPVLKLLVALSTFFGITVLAPGIVNLITSIRTQQNVASRLSDVSPMSLWIAPVRPKLIGSLHYFTLLSF